MLWTNWAKTPSTEFSHRTTLVRLDLALPDGFRCDLIVEGLVIFEVKAIEALGPLHFTQTLTYLRFADMRLGNLINFNVYKIKDGIKRVVNQLPE